MLFVILVLILSVPKVQTRLGKYATKRINSKYGTHISLEQLGLQFNGDIVLKKIYIEDYKKDTLIYASKLNTSIINVPNLVSGYLTFGDININDVVFNVKSYKGDKGTNLDAFVDRFLVKKTSAKKSKFLLSSSDVSVHNAVFNLIDENKSTKELLLLKNVNINATNFLIKGPRVSMRVNTLNFKDKRGFELENLSTDFSYTLHDMKFLNLNLKTKKSYLIGDLSFFYKRSDFKHFVDKVKLEANFKNSKVYFADLNHFYNEFTVGQYAHFNAHLMGTLNRLAVSNVKLKTNKNTKLFGDFIFKNLIKAKPNTFFMDANLKNLTSNYQDFTGILPHVLKKNIPKSFSKLGTFVLTGNTQVTAKRVIADVALETDIGAVTTNLDIDNVYKTNKAKYNGTIALNNFNLGTMLGQPKLGLVTLNMEAKGTGFTSKSINTKLKGAVFNAYYNNYNYKNLSIAGYFHNKIFDGNLVAKDPNLKLDFIGLVDFSEKINKYDFEATIKHANLNALNFVTKDSVSILKSKIKLNINASNIDDAQGEITLKNTSYKNKNDSFNFKKIEVSSRFKDSNRFINVNAPGIVDGNLNGYFVFKDIGNLVKNALGNLYSNYKPHQVLENQHIDFQFKIYNKIVEVLYPDLSLGKNTFLKGRVESNQEKFRLTFKSPKVQVVNNFAKNIALQVDNGNPLFNAFLEVDSLKTKHYSLSKVNLINVTLNDTLFVRTEFTGGKKNKDKYNLNVYHTINNENKSVVGFKESDITIKDNLWTINDTNSNKIIFNKKLTEFRLEDIKLKHLNQEVSLSGVIKNSTEKDLKLNFKNVDLAKITPSIDSLSLAGRVNGRLDLLQKNGSYLPNSSVVVDGFTINDFLLGSFDASITGNADLTNYTVNAGIKNDNKNAFKAIGNINVEKNNPTIDVDLQFKDFNLNVLNPFLKNVLNNIRGQATGTAKVIGDLKKPGFNGELYLYKSGLGIPYLNVDYDFEDNASISLKNQSFVFNNINVTDVKHNSKGVLFGEINHNNFAKWNLDLGLKTPRLLVLDTQQTDESLYFGTGFIGGRASIKGPVEELLISVEGETKAGTIFKIPIDDTESFGDNTYIHFITSEQKKAKANGEDFVLEQIKGLELYFDLDVTEDAEVEIIIDENTGHSLRGSGSGGLLVEINTTGKFNMWGDFSVFKGVYNFAYGGLVQKEFIVQPGGTVSWDGEPLGARIDMLAVYKTQANPSPLLDNPISRSIPVELDINLNGGLEQLDPNFTFQFPNVNSTIKSELQYRLESEDDKENQALYLLSTGAFSRGLDDLNFSGTIAERLNGIINGIFTNDDGKIDIGLNYEAGENRPDFRSSDRFGVTIKTQISDRVLINGKVGVPVGGAGANETVVAGDAEIDFLLNEDGTLTAKVFNRENSIRNFGEAIGYTQGIGLSYNLDFDTFKELLRTIFSKKEEKIKLLDKKKKLENKSALPEFIKYKTSKSD